MVAEALIVLSLTSAAASTTYLGETDQGYPARAVVRSGDIDRIRLKWDAPCQTPGYAWGPQGTVWFNREPAPFEVSGKRFSDGGTYKFSFTGGRAVVTQRLSGRFVDGKSVAGTQSSTVRVYDDGGKKLDSCSSEVRFKAVPRKRLP